jgi:hypothetical protein
VAGLALHGQICQELQIDFDEAGSFAFRTTSPIFTVEAEVFGCQVSQSRVSGLGKDAADFIKQIQVGRGDAAGSLADQ